MREVFSAWRLMEKCSFALVLVQSNERIPCNASVRTHSHSSKGNLCDFKESLLLLSTKCHYTARPEHCLLGDKLPSDYSQHRD